MAGASVKSVGFMPGAAASPKEQGAKSVLSGEFQKLWNNQSGKAETPAETAGKTVKKTPGDSMKARNEHLMRQARASQDTQAAKTPDELTDEELAEAMEVLGTAAMEVMQQLADILDMSLEEMQGIMKELGVEPLELLNSEKLGALFLQLAGAEGSYALVTNEELYDSYQSLMGQLKNVLQDTASKLGGDEGQLEGLIQTLQEQMQLEPEQRAEIVEPKIQVEDLRSDEAPVQSKDGEQTLTQETAQETVQKNAAEGDAQSEEQGRQPADKGETSNLVLQTLKAEQSQAGVQQAAQSQSAQFYDVETQNIMRQIMDYMRVQVKQDMSELEMQLHPASLGTLHIQLASRGGQVTANFIAQNEMVKAALESQMVQLQESFEEQGIKVNSIEVTVQTHQFEQNLEQGRGNNRGQEPERKPRVRRIHLDDLAEAELNPEDTLAAEMMAAGGNTVDYTA